MRHALSILLVLVTFSVHAADLSQLMQQVKANPQGQLDTQLKHPAKTAEEHFLLAYSHYVLNNKEAALEFSNKAMTLAASY
jgi:Tfp pilus assembly protein PilP